MQEKGKNNLPELVCRFTVVTGSLYSIEQKPESSGNESPLQQK